MPKCETEHNLAHFSPRISISLNGGEQATGIVTNTGNKHNRLNVGRIAL